MNLVGKNQVFQARLFFLEWFQWAKWPKGRSVLSLVVLTKLCDQYLPRRFRIVDLTLEVRVGLICARPIIGNLRSSHAKTVNSISGDSQPNATLSNRLNASYFDECGIP